MMGTRWCTCSVTWGTSPSRPPSTATGTLPTARACDRYAVDFGLDAYRPDLAAPALGHDRSGPRTGSSAATWALKACPVVVYVSDDRVPGRRWQMHSTLVALPDWRTTVSARRAPVRTKTSSNQAAI